MFQLELEYQNNLEFEFQTFHAELLLYQIATRLSLYDI